MSPAPNRIIPPAKRIESIQSVMREEADYWRTIDRELEAEALDSYANILERIRRQMLEEEVECRP